MTTVAPTASSVYVVLSPTLVGWVELSVLSEKEKYAVAFGAASACSCITARITASSVTGVAHNCRSSK